VVEDIPRSLVCKKTLQIEDAFRISYSTAVEMLEFYRKNHVPVVGSERGVVCVMSESREKTSTAKEGNENIEDKSRGYYIL
jgi:hypothetical protein